MATIGGPVGPTASAAQAQGPFKVTFNGGLNELIAHLKDLYESHLNKGMSAEALQSILQRLQTRAATAAPGAVAPGVAGLGAAAVDPAAAAAAAAAGGTPGDPDAKALHGIRSITDALQAAHPYWPPGWLMHPDQHTGVPYPGWHSGSPDVPRHIIGARQTGRGPFG